MTTNNPLTIDNIVYLLNQENYTVEQLTTLSVDNPNRFKLSDYNKFAKKLLDYFFTDYVTIKMSYDGPEYFGAPILLNERIKLKWLENFSSIEFNSLYPNIIVKLWEKGELKFNIYEFGIIFKFIVQNYKTIKKNPNLTDVSRLLIKYFINFTFGATVNRFDTSFIYLNSHDKIVSYTKETFEHLMEQNTNNIFYIDTDTIYLDYITPEVLSNVKSLGVPYSIETNLNGMFLEKKRYQIQKNGDLKIRGLQGSFRSKYKLEKNRINKLQKILHKIHERDETQLVN